MNKPYQYQSDIKLRDDIVQTEDIPRSHEAWEEFAERYGDRVVYQAQEFDFEPEEIMNDLYVHLQDDDWHRFKEWKGKGLGAWVSLTTFRRCVDRWR